MPEIIIPESREHWLQLRTKDITSTEMSALFGLSPYMTEFELWHLKKSGDVVSFESNERMSWGNRLEEAIAKGISEDKQIPISRMDEYIRDTDNRMAASFDYSIDTDPKGILEIKNVDGLQFRDKWVIEDGKVVEAPAHIEIQCQQQLAVSGRERLVLGALVGGNTLHLIERTPDENIISKMRAKAKSFWQSIEDNNPPKPDFEKDAEFIKQLYNYADPNKHIETDDPMIEALVADHKRITAQVKELELKRDGIKSQLLIKIGDAEKCIGSNFTISAGITGEAEISFKRKAFRNFRISHRKDKK